MDDVVSASASLQEELENIHTLSEQYEAIAQTAQTQGEMNMVVWMVSQNLGYGTE